jgi:Pentapeptide repeats (8 copies)
MLDRINEWRVVLLVPPKGPLEALEAAEARRKFHQFGTAAVLVVGSALAVLLWLIPKQFHDPEEARVIMFAFITGLLTIGLSAPVIGRLRREEKTRVEALRDKERELGGEELHRSVEELLDLQKILDEELDKKISRVEEEIPEGRLPQQINWADEKPVDEEAPTPRAAPDRLLLSWVNLRNADLQGEDFRGAVLQGADLRGARLDSADLREADLRDCRLEGASLDGVIYDRNTIWPASIDRKALETMRPETAPKDEADAG